MIGVRDLPAPSVLVFSFKAIMVPTTVRVLVFCWVLKFSLDHFR